MKLYTIQPEFKISELEQTGVLKSGEKIMDDYFLDSYAWLEDKMRELLPLPDIECKHPIWAWYKHRGKRKPDLRNSGYGNRGEKLYRIEFDIDDDKVLLSDFSDWHFVLNSINEDKLFKQTSLPLDWHSKEEIEEGIKEGWKVLGDKLIYNWENIFNINLFKEDVQATIWYVKMEQVIDINKFNCK